MDEPRRRFAELARRAARGITALERDRVCCGTLTLQQFETLRRVEDAGAVATGALAAALGIDLSTASRNVTLLERQGLLRRARSADDGRVVNVELTPEGAETLRSLCCDEQMIFAAVFARIPACRRDAVIDALDTLAGALGAEASPPACCPPTPPLAPSAPLPNTARSRRSPR